MLWWPLPSRRTSLGPGWVRGVNGKGGDGGLGRERIQWEPWCSANPFLQQGLPGAGGRRWLTFGPYNQPHVQRMGVQDGERSRQSLGHKNEQGGTGNNAAAGKRTVQHDRGLSGHLVACAGFRHAHIVLSTHTHTHTHIHIHIHKGPHSPLVPPPPLRPESHRWHQGHLVFQNGPLV